MDGVTLRSKTDFMAVRLVASSGRTGCAPHRQHVGDASRDTLVLPAVRMPRCAGSSLRDSVDAVRW